MAFDRVNALYYKLRMCGLSMKFLNTVRSMYDRTPCVDGEVFEPSGTCFGVRQGWVMSMLLFALFLNDVHDSFTGEVNVEGR